MSQVSDTPSCIILWSNIACWKFLCFFHDFPSCKPPWKTGECMRLALLTEGNTYIPHYMFHSWLLISHQHSMKISNQIKYSLSRIVQLFSHCAIMANSHVWFHISHSIPVKCLGYDRVSGFAPRLIALFQIISWISPLRNNVTWIV